MKDLGAWKRLDHRRVVGSHVEKDRGRGGGIGGAGRFRVFVEERESVLVFFFSFKCYEFLNFLY